MVAQSYHYWNSARNADSPLIRAVLKICVTLNLSVHILLF